MFILLQFVNCFDIYSFYNEIDFKVSIFHHSSNVVNTRAQVVKKANILLIVFKNVYLVAKCVLLPDV